MTATLRQAQDSAAPAKPPRVSREEDPRNPNLRLAALLDPGTMTLLTPDDDSGMLAAAGAVKGNPVVAFCSDATALATTIRDADTGVRGLHGKIPL
jgi:acetyl-CoA/propionyl-CoA carboxylase carboxyl transferase subunit